jgi:SAM-dependent methyltransferase
LDDRDGAAGYDRHYFLHTAWAARVLAETSPTSHVDVSSHLTFSAVASAFVPMTLLEFAPPPTPVEGLEIQRGDVTRLPLADGSVKSLSCMHVVEHIGLGRYGDALDPEGDLKAMGELRRVLAPGGQLLLVVPVGRPRVVFNAHRVYDPGMVVEGLRPLKLSEFALIPDNHADGDLVRRADLSLGLHQSYGCGCFHFMKSSPE